MTFRITYSVLNADLSALHKEFDGVLAQVKAKLGEEFPSWIAGGAVFGSSQIEDRNPANTKQILAKFHCAPLSEIERAVETARKTQRSWGRTPWQERVKLMRKAADLISERRLELSAIMSLEAGKNRMESLGDVEESADLIRYYAQTLEENSGYRRPLGKLSPNENTQDILKPFGVFLVISPFNFPLALSTGMSAAALLAGNSVLLKPSQETPWCAQKLYECLRDAGLPEGVFQVLHGRGAELGDALAKHPGIDGIAFTGSKFVGMQLLHHFSKDYPKPVLLEMGGKNPAIVCAKADLDKAIEGCARSGFGLTGQKCSALSRIYVHRSIKDAFLKGLVEKAKTFKIGDPTDKDVFVGPIINQKALDRHLGAIADAKRDGKIVFGGEDLRAKPEFAGGYFVQPTIVEVPRGHRLTRDELFSPFLTVDTFDTVEEAVQESNRCEYGLTAGIFSENKDDVEYFMDNIEAGILYANRKTGATTGAWPGVQSFCGWKGSGSTGKGGCGPYYVSQFMKEQSQTRME
jgi:1-pyrroline-5-carboxylate dehydrogenase